MGNAGITKGAAQIPRAQNTDICFFERDQGSSLIRRSAIEGVGTLCLMFAATGSGLESSQLSVAHTAVGLVISAFAISGALIGLILAFGSISGGHYNPLISGLQWLDGERSLGCALAYIAAQIVGSSLGASLARLLFDAERLRPPSPFDWRLIASEIVASTALMMIVLGVSRSRRSQLASFAVGSWLIGAIICTPSGSYANPAITIGSLFAAGPIALSNEMTLFYVPAQIIGGVLALILIHAFYPISPAFEGPA